MCDDLFDQLKKEGPISKTNNDKEFPKEQPTKTYVNNNAPTLENFVNKQQLTPQDSSCLNYNSSPVPLSDTGTKSNKSNSVSPYDISIEKTNIVKSLKVRLKRTTIEKHLTQPLKKQVKRLKAKPKSINKTNNVPVKMTLTKAQQKSFEPILIGDGVKNIKPKIKLCTVRIKRVNLQKLQQQCNRKTKKQPLKKRIKKTLPGIPKPAPPTHIKVTSQVLSPPKKGRISNVTAKTTIKTNRALFSIKLKPSPTTKKEKEKKRVSPAKYQKSQFSRNTKKFISPKLIKIYGKRVFSAYVLMKRCTHPRMLAFESSARAGLNSKNVTFCEQVEVFGDSSDSDDQNVTKNSNKLNAQLITPARLTKAEIEFDPATPSSTPSVLKKSKHKSVNPLKKGGNPSPRKEQLKRGDERWRTCKNGEDDDEDEDCEYIVPHDIPTKRPSRTSCNAILDASTNSNPTIDEIINKEKTVQEIINKEKIIDEIKNKQKNIVETKNAENCELPTVQSNLQNGKTTTDNMECNTDEQKRPPSNINLNGDASFKSIVIGDQTDKELDSDTALNYLPELTSLQASSIDLFDELLEQEHNRSQKDDDASKTNCLKSSFDDIQMKILSDDLDPRSESNPANPTEDIIINELARNVNDVTD